MRPTRIWSAKLGKYLPINYDYHPHPNSSQGSEPSFFKKVNFIDFLFRLFVFVFIGLPISYVVLAIYFGIFGLKGGFIILGIAYVLIILCFLSQEPPQRIFITLAMLIRATALLPFTLLGSFFFGQAPAGPVLTGGVIADTIRDLFRR